MERRSFLKAVGAAALLAPALSKAALARKDNDHDEPKQGTKKEVPAEVNGTVTLPAWPHGASSTATDAMLMFRGNPEHNAAG